MRAIGTGNLAAQHLRRRPTNSPDLRDSFAVPPRLLLEEDGAELAEPGRAIREHFENVVSLGDLEGEHCRFVFSRGLEPLGCVVESGVSQFADECEDEPIGDVRRRASACGHAIPELFVM